MAASLMIRPSESFTLQSAAAVAVGTEYGLPARALQIEYQVVAAGAVTVLIQGSLDNANWYTLATVAAAAAGSGTIRTSSKYIRSNITVNAGSSATVVTVNAKVYGDVIAALPNTTRVLAASAVAVSGAADTAENILATVTVPAGIMGRNGYLRVRTQWLFTGSANAKNLRVRLGGIGGTAYLATSRTSGTEVAYVDDRIIQNRGSEASQVGTPGGIQLGGSTAAAGTSTVDTSASTTLVITGEKASGAEVLTLSSYIVEVCHLD